MLFYFDDIYVRVDSVIKVVCIQYMMCMHMHMYTLRYAYMMHMHRVPDKGARQVFK